MMRPNFDYVEDRWLARKVYNKLSIRYILAISCIAIMIIANQVLARKQMSRQLDDSRVINVAGRQRMLSQKLSKEVILLVNEENSSKREFLIKKSDKTFKQWQRAHLGLQHGDNELGLPGINTYDIQELFKRIQPHFDLISRNYLVIQEKIESSPAIDTEQLKVYLDNLLDNEPAFLSIMDNIVFQYDYEAKDRVSSLINLETSLLFVALVVLIFEIIFIFWPTAVYTKSIVNDLIESEEEQKQLKDKLVIKTKSEQKELSAVFFEGQERERRRIARDLHDGIGQLLTGLKFQIEAMDTDDTESIRFKIAEIKGLTGDIIKEVRRASFDLRPTVLSDYGLVSATRNIVQELNKLTETKISLANKTGFNQRFEKKLETHIFRIVQEAINNALKYAKAKSIWVEFLHDEEFLEVKVKDDGIGFKLDNIRDMGYQMRKGHGLFNMKERCEFIDADLNIISEPEKGTLIHIQVPLPEQSI